MPTISISQKEQLMRDYWLGALAVDDSASREDEWFGTDADAEMLEGVRSELIGDYLSEALSAGEKHLFERNFLAVPVNLRDTAIIKGHQKLIDEKKVQAFAVGQLAETADRSTSFWQKLNDLFTGRLTQTALLAAMILVAFGVFVTYKIVIIKNNPGNNETAQVKPSENLPGTAELPVSNEPDATPGTTSANSASANTAVNKTKTSINKNIHLPKPDESTLPGNKNTNLPKPIENPPLKPKNSAPFVVTLALVAFGGGTRAGELSSNGETKTAVLDEKTKTVRLQVPTGDLDTAYKGYEGKIVSQSDDREIYTFKQENLKKGVGKALSIEIPARLLASGDYLLTVSFKPSKNEKNSAAESIPAKAKILDFFFNVKK